MQDKQRGDKSATSRRKELAWESLISRGELQHICKYDCGKMDAMYRYIHEYLSKWRGAAVMIWAVMNIS
jgi:hypothetical protein